MVSALTIRIVGLAGGFCSPGFLLTGVVWCVSVDGMERLSDERLRQVRYSIEFYKDLVFVSPDEVLTVIDEVMEYREGLEAYQWD